MYGLGSSYSEDRSGGETLGPASAYGGTSGPMWGAPLPLPVSGPRVDQPPLPPPVAGLGRPPASDEGPVAAPVRPAVQEQPVREPLPFGGLQTGSGKPKLISEEARARALRLCDAEAGAGPRQAPWAEGVVCILVAHPSCSNTRFNN